MVNYSNSKIYKLVNNNCSEGNCYYGSTTQPLHKRFYEHKCHFKCWKERKKGYTTSFQLFQEDFENVKIILVEEVKCENKQQLLARERFYIENNKCLNKCIPGRTNKEYMKEYNKTNADKIKEKRKEHYKKNADKIKEYKKEYYKTNANKQKEYRKKNADKIKKYYKEYVKEYYKKNADKCKEYRKEYYKANADKIKQKIKCEFCGCFTRKSNLRRHQRSIKCKNISQNNI